MRFTALLGALDPEAGPLLPRGTVFADAVEALGRAASAAVLRLSPDPPWEFASKATGGLLLAPPCPGAERPVVGNTS